MIRNIYSLLVSLGFNYKLVRRNVKGLFPFYKDYRQIKKQLKHSNDFKISRLYPILHERYTESAQLKGHYFLQDLYVAERVLKNNPVKHVDVGSRIDGFVAHLACAREVEVFDIRPQVTQIRNIRFMQADFMEIAPELHGYTESLSSLNVIEHFGLGRYNDPIDIDGHLKGLQSMHKALKPGGRFYFSTPIGPQRIEFNAHRVFSVKYLLEIFAPDYTIERFSYIDDEWNLHENVALDSQRALQNYGCKFGCGIFEMIKK